MRKVIHQLIESIQPFDSLEAEHLSGTMDWIQSGAGLFRIEKPATPPKHLVA
ncbi:MAG: hypothetical protein ACOYKZ_04380 [Chlamydiia bacterium]